MILRLVRKIRSSPRTIVTLFLLALFRLIPSSRRRTISISFNANLADDGTGAQIQRMIAARALSLILGTSYIHIPLQKVAIHPLDPFQTLEDMNQFVSSVNSEISFPSTKEQSFGKEISIANLNNKDLLFLILLAIRGSETHLKILNPYLLVDLFPSSYLSAISTLTKRFLTERDGSEKLIAIHYRQGVGGFAIYPGMKIPRQIAIDVYIRKVKEIIKNSKENMRIIIYTDAPVVPVSYTPLKGQEQLWNGSPSFSDGKLEIKSLDIAQLFAQNGLSCEIRSGGDPLEAIKSLATSDYLLMSRSSLSYIAALLANQSTVVYFPEGFWHPKLRGWQNL